MAGSIWSGERCQSSSAVSLIFGQFKLRCSLFSFFFFWSLLTFWWGDGGVREGWVTIKAPRTFPSVTIDWSGIGSHFRCWCNSNGMQSFYRSPAKQKTTTKKPPNQNKHTLFFVSRAWAPPTSLFLELPLILKCPLALGSLTAPWQQLRPSTKQCNVYS